METPYATVFHWVLIACLLHVTYRPIIPERRYNAGMVYKWTWDAPVCHEQIFVLLRTPDSEIPVFCWAHHAFNEPVPHTIRIVLFDCFTQHRQMKSVEAQLSAMTASLLEAPVQAQQVQQTWFDFPDEVYAMSDEDKATTLCQVISTVVHQDSHGFAGFPARVIAPNQPVPSQLPCWEPLHRLLPASIVEERVVSLIEQLRNGTLSVASISAPGNLVPSPVCLHR